MQSQVDGVRDDAAGVILCGHDDDDDGYEYEDGLSVTEKTGVIRLPRELVLRSTVVEQKDELDSPVEDWDAVLAVKLLDECRSGRESKLYGYCSLLMRSDDPTYFTSDGDDTTATPTITAPDAVPKAPLITACTHPTSEDASRKKEEVIRPR